MSIVNVFVRPDVALVGVDTEWLMPDGSYVDGCKMLLLPHIDAVVAFRGLSTSLAGASAWIVHFSGDFDELSEKMESFIKESRGYAKDDSEGNFFLVGYSPRLGRMVAHAYEVKEGSSDVSHLADFPSMFAPAFGADVMAEWKVKFDKESMFRVANDQCRLVREQNEAWPAGGRFYITEIRKDSMSTELAGNLLPR